MILVRYEAFPVNIIGNYRYSLEVRHFIFLWLFWLLVFLEHILELIFIFKFHSTSYWIILINVLLYWVYFIESVLDRVIEFSVKLWLLFDFFSFLRLLFFCYFLVFFKFWHISVTPDVIVVIIPEIISSCSWLWFRTCTCTSWLRSFDLLLGLGLKRFDDIAGLFVQFLYFIHGWLRTHLKLDLVRLDLIIIIFE